MNVVLGAADRRREVSTAGPAVRAAPVLRSWPLLILALPAAVAVWSGWVGIGEMAGFGDIRPLPGIWSSLHLDTAVTLPAGVEAYAAIALQAWLTSSPAVTTRTRLFAQWSAIGALALGVTGQVAYHLLAEAHVTRAPWEVTTLVSSLPVLVLGFGTALAHMLRADAAVAAAGGPARDEGTDQDRGPGELVRGPFPCRDRGDTHGASDPGLSPRLQEARAAAAKLAAAGKKVSRRALRSAGLRGSNAELGALARRIHADSLPTT